MMKVGVLTSCYGVGVRRAVRIASEQGAEGVQLCCTGTEVDPEELSWSGRQELKDYLESYGLLLVALRCEEGALTDPDTVEKRIERAKKVVHLAMDLECRVITSHVGALGYGTTDSRWMTALDALSDLGRYAINFDVRWAIETGPDDPRVLKRFLQQLKTDGVAANYSPGNLIMNGFDHLAGVPTLRPWIVHTHANDAVPAEEDKPARVVSLGEGLVDFRTYLRTLFESGYNDFVTVERGSGDEPITETGRAIRFLLEKIARVHRAAS